MSTPTYDKMDIRRMLRRNGYFPHHQTGSHVIYRNKDGRHLTIRVSNQNKMVLQRLIKEYNLKVN